LICMILASSSAMRCSSLRRVRFMSESVLKSGLRGQTA
jgi:hypothetical protein